MGGGGGGDDGQLAQQQAELAAQQQALKEKEQKINAERLAALRARLTTGGLFGQVPQGPATTKATTLGASTP